MSEGSPQRITLHYFAWVRERIGFGTEEVELPDGVGTVAEVVGWLKARGPEFDAAFERPELVRAAIDKVHAKPGASIANAREIAFFPPVTGG